MKKLAEACERMAATTKKLEKTAIVAEYLKSASVGEAAVACVFLSGHPFVVWEETTLQVGGRLLWRVVAELAGKDEGELAAAYRRLGDLGAVAGDVLPARVGQGVGVLEVSRSFREIAVARGPAAKTFLVRELLERASPLEAKYIVKIMTGDLRIGLKESLVEDAIGRAYAVTLAEVQRVNMLLGDIGETLRLAALGKLGKARMRLFHPLGFMLASPVESAEEGLSYFAEAAVEDKYDGIRAQAHVSGGEVKIFSRTRDEITESFPELPDALAGLDDVILDGEIVAWEFGESGPQGLKPASVTESNGTAEAVPFPHAVGVQSLVAETKSEEQDSGRARPFSVLQQRLGRKKVSEKMLREVPVAFLVFDVLYSEGELVIDRPLALRARVLDALLADKHLNHRGHGVTQRKGGQGTLAFADDHEMARTRVIRAPVFRAPSPEQLDGLFDAAQGPGE